MNSLTPLSFLLNWIGTIGSIFIVIGFMIYYFIFLDMEYQEKGPYQVVYSIAFLLINVGGGLCLVRCIKELFIKEKQLDRDFYFALLFYVLVFIGYWA